jgi:hypothetical protein
MDGFCVLELKLTFPAGVPHTTRFVAFTGPLRQLNADTNIARLAGTRRNAPRTAEGSGVRVARPT